MRTKAVEVVLEFFTVQRVNRQQLFNAVDDRHGVSAGLFVLRINRLFRVGHLDEVRRLFGEPAGNFKALKPLSDKLNLIVFALKFVHFDRSTDLRETFVIQGGDTLLAHKGNTQCVVRRVTHTAHGLFPALTINHQRLYLGGEERPVMNRQEVNAFGQHFTSGHQRVYPLAV